MAIRPDEQLLDGTYGTTNPIIPKNTITSERHRDIVESKVSRYSIQNPDDTTPEGQLILENNQRQDEQDQHLEEYKQAQNIVDSAQDERIDTLDRTTVKSVNGINPDAEGNVDVETLPDAPEDGKTYGRKDAEWVELSDSGSVSVNGLSGAIQNSLLDGQSILMLDGTNKGLTLITPNSNDPVTISNVNIMYRLESGEGINELTFNNQYLDLTNIAIRKGMVSSQFFMAGQLMTPSDADSTGKYRITAVSFSVNPTNGNADGKITVEPILPESSIYMNTLSNISVDTNEKLTLSYQVITISKTIKLLFLYAVYNFTQTPTNTNKTLYDLKTLPGIGDFTTITTVQMSQATHDLIDADSTAEINTVVTSDGLFNLTQLTINGPDPIPAAMFKLNFSLGLNIEQ